MQSLPTIAGPTSGRSPVHGAPAWSHSECVPLRHTFSGTGWISSNGWPALS